jgi:8-oxo-dGTP diphosphatase
MILLKKGVRLMVAHPRNPYLTVDIIIETSQGIVLIERKNSPYGWALPGGFVDYGETLEHAAKREAREETALLVELIEQFHTYSDPSRDPRHHTVSTVFIAKGNHLPIGGDDARRAAIFKLTDLPSPLVFDHSDIINDYIKYHQGVSKTDIFKSSM